MLTDTKCKQAKDKVYVMCDEKGLRLEIHPNINPVRE